MKFYPNQNIPLNQNNFQLQAFKGRRIIENTFGIATTHFEYSEDQ